MKTTIIIGTYYGAPHHHMRQLVASNPQADIRLAISEGAGDPDRVKWRNGDRPYRDWWKRFGHTVDRESTIVLIEQDVLVTKCLDRPVPAGLQGAEIKTDNRWSWWDNETPKLPQNMRPFAVGLVPLAVYFTNWNCMEAIASWSFDDLFANDVFSELRFPTIAAFTGFQVSAIELPAVKWYETAPDMSQPSIAALGIYHAIKHPAP